MYQQNHVARRVADKSAQLPRLGVNRGMDSRGAEKGLSKLLRHSSTQANIVSNRVKKLLGAHEPFHASTECPMATSIVRASPARS